MEHQFMDRNTMSFPEECPGQVVAMEYVPWQRLEQVYEVEDGFCRGTIFPELDKPWMVGGDCCE